MKTARAGRTIQDAFAEAARKSERIAVLMPAEIPVLVSPRIITPTSRIRETTVRPAQRHALARAASVVRPADAVNSATGTR
jgi:hypothetical protein